MEDYVHIMELLVNDVRFNMYNVCYKRILVLWIFTAFIVLLGLLFSGVTGLTLFGLGVMWLMLNAAAIFFCMFIKIKLNHNLEKCMAQVNKHLLRHKILLGLDDRGKISCHKVNLCFIYFDTTDCVVSITTISLYDFCLSLITFKHTYICSKLIHNDTCFITEKASRNNRTGGTGRQNIR